MERSLKIEQHNKKGGKLMETLIGATLNEQRAFEQHQKEIIKRIEKHEQYLVENNILAGISSFKSEVESFYGLFSYDSAFPPFDIEIGIIEKSRLKDQGVKNKGKCPRDLIEILSNFNKKSFDASKLQYDSVREDCQIWNSLLRKAIKMMISILAFVGSISAICLLNESSTKLTVVAIFILATIMANIGTLWPYSRSYPRPRKTNGGLAEYKRLLKSAGRADWFMKHTFREYFVEKCYHKN